MQVGPGWIGSGSWAQLGLVVKGGTNKVGEGYRGGWVPVTRGQGIDCSVRRLVQGEKIQGILDQVKPEVTLHYRRSLSNGDVFSGGKGKERKSGEKPCQSLRYYTDSQTSTI